MSQFVVPAIQITGVDFERLWANPHWPMWYLAALFMWRLVTPLLLKHWIALPLSVVMAALARNTDVSWSLLNTAIFIAVLMINTDSKFFVAFSFPIYILIVLTLLLVLAIGTEINGAKAWIQIGSVSLQPSEFMKMATSLAIAVSTSSWALLARGSARSW